MEKGDISNEVVPRLCLVFEGLVGVLPPQNIRKETVARKLGRWKSVVNSYEVNEPIAKRVWDLVWNHNFGLEVVTWMPHAAVEHVSAWIDAQALPIANVFCSTPILLSRSLSYRLDLAAIYDPDPKHYLLFGSKGRIVIDPARTDMLGSFS